MPTLVDEESPCKKALTVWGIMKWGSFLRMLPELSTTKNRSILSSTAFVAQQGFWDKSNKEPTIYRIIRCQLKTIERLCAIMDSSFTLCDKDWGRLIDLGFNKGNRNECAMALIQHDYGRLMNHPGNLQTKRLLQNEAGQNQGRAYLLVMTSYLDGLRQNNAMRSLRHMIALE